MDFGCFYFPTDYGMDVAELAQAMESRGLESLFLCEHTHIPSSRRTPFPAGGDLPRRYVHTHDPLVGLSFAAAATKRLKLGTGICLLPQRDPIVTAKAIASLDCMSGGRFVFGVGGGWNREEMESHGVDYASRFRRLEEHVQVMKALWTEEEAQFEGEFVRLEPSWSYPKPQQQPHPPILLGGETDHTLRRVVRFCDGWFPRASHGFSAADGMARLERVAAEAGRARDTLQVTVFRAPADEAALAEMREAGVNRVLLEIPDAGRDEILPLLDRYAALSA